ncbi:MAG: transcription elongation factor GreA [Bdellovibrionota bacterium]
MEKVPMTVEGKQKVLDEIDHLKKVERPKVSKEIEEARAHGDLSENAEYHAAREKQGLNEARLRFLEDHIARAEVISPDQIKTDRVMFGVTVKIYDESADAEKTYRIVGELESDIDRGLLSVVSPIARALIGKEEGDVVTVQTPGGAKEFEVLEISK